MKRTIIVTAIIMFLSTLFVYSPVSAHRMLIVHNGDDRFIVQYDDGTAASQATVHIYDDQGEVLLSERTDENGAFSIPANVSYARIVASDGMGHRVTWVPEERTSIIEGIPLWVRAIFGCSILLFIAAIFRRRTYSAERSAS